MRNLLRSRRGSAAFATVIALVPLIGVVALGGEAGSWYITKQHAQNAADAAAYSGALRLACTVAGEATCDAESVTYRGREFAAQNGFCDGSDATSYPGSTCATRLPAGISQAVTINTLTTWNGTSGNFVQAIVSQQQPAYLAAVLGLTTVNIPAQAVAQVINPNPICGLGLSKSPSSSSIGLTLGGSLDLAGNGCGLMSDGKVKFNSTVSASSGSGWAAYAVNGCNASAGTCSNPGLPYDYFMQYVPDPLSGLDTASFTLGAGTTTSCGSKCTTYSPGAYNKLTVNAGDAVHFKPGVYSFSGNVSITGGAIDCPTCSCVGNPTATSGTTGVNIVITGSGTKLTINSASVTLCAGTNYSGTNAALNGVLIDDQATGAVSVSGNAGAGQPVELDGAIYAPNSGVTWSGTSDFASNTCAEVIGYTLTMTGSAYLSTDNCASGTVPFTEVVTLVQ